MIAYLSIGIISLNEIILRLLRCVSAAKTFSKFRILTPKRVGLVESKQNTATFEQGFRLHSDRRCSNV